MKRDGVPRARRIWLGVTVAAVVGAAAVVTAQVRGGDSPDPGTTSTSFTCRAGDQLATSDFDGERIPAGAVAVRLCQGNTAGVAFQDPLDELTTGIATLTTLVNRQPSTPPSSECHGDGGIGYTMLFRYADETVLAVAGELYGCRHLSVGSHDAWRQNPEAVWNEYLHLLRAQRADADPPGQASVREVAAAATDCPSQPTPSPLAQATEMTAAVLCLRHPHHPDRAGHVVVPSGDLDVLLRDRREADGDRPPTRADCEAGVPVVDLVGTTAWGDLVVLGAECGVFLDVEVDPPADAYPFWRPDQRSRAILARLVAQIRSET